MTSQQIIVYFLAPLAGYLLGSVPFAFVIGKTRGVDIRTTGSKNIGATNLGRTLGLRFFWIAFLLDAAKGFFPVLLVALLARRGYAVYFGPNYTPLPPGSPGYSPLGIWIVHHTFPSWSPLLTAIACVLGHNFPIWLKFKGGKGVATSFGVVLGFWPLYTCAGIGAGLIFIFTLMVYRYISLASIVGALAFFGLVVCLGTAEHLSTFTAPDQLLPLAIIAGLFAAMIILRHRANIARLLKGTEPQIGQRERDKARLK